MFFVMLQLPLLLMVGSWRCSLRVIFKLIFSIIVVPLLNYLGVMLESFWEHVGIVLGSCLDAPEIILDFSRNHFAITLETCWDHVGIILG